MIETILASLIVAFISALAYIAYKHPKSFTTIFVVLLVITFILYLISLAFHSGMMRAKESIPDSIPWEQKDIIREAIKSRELPIEFIVAICLAFIVYLNILHYLPSILNLGSDEKSNSPDEGKD